MVPNLSERLVAGLLIVYLLAVGTFASVNLVASFNEDQGVTASNGSDASCKQWLLACHVRSKDSKLLLQAALAGTVGSFLHAAQSLTSYVGNDTFKMSWGPWYLMRPWIGAILALAMALAAQAGLVGASGGGNANIHGIAALGLLGGWFSKTTTDKFQEVFSTLFKTDADKERTDKLKGDQPVIARIDPPSVPTSAIEITIKGTGFIAGARVTVDGKDLDATFVSPTELTIDLTKLIPRPSGRVPVVITNPSGAKPKSEKFSVTFE